MSLTIYSQARCQACDTLKARLKRDGIEFTEVRIDQDAEAKAFVVGQGHRSVPVVYQDGVHVPDINTL